MTGPGSNLVDRLDIGDFLPDFALSDQKAHRVTLATHALGKAIVLLFYPNNHMPACQQQLRAFAAVHDRLGELAHVFAINRDPVEANAAAAKMLAPPFRLLGDPGGDAARAYAVSHNLTAQHDFLGCGAFTSIVADANRRILQIKRDVTEPGHAEAVFAFLAGRGRDTPRELTGFAPVLYVPAVFEPAFCRHLIEVYENRGNQPSGTLHDDGQGGRTTRYNPATKVRRDHYVNEPGLTEQIWDRLKRRIVPEIHRAFSYRVTRFEEFKVVCYEAADGGHFAPHRDNNSLASVHRRFALTLNLNTGEYEGGHLRFQEYGPHLYRPAAGDAVAFSCSLLHQALPVTAGKRFVFLSFLFGDEALEMHAKRRSALG